MKKKLIATLVAGAVLSTGIIGLTACGGGLSIPKGGEVADKEAWVKAFTDTVALKNYTLESYSSIDFTLKGAYKNSNSKDVPVDISSKATASAVVLYDSENNKAYSETSTNSEAKGTENGVEEGGKYSYTNKEYYELSEEKNSVKYYWNADYSKGDLKSTEGVSSEEQYWDADETAYFASSMLTGLSTNVLFYETEEAVIPQSVATLYDKFTYDGGVYTATLYVTADFNKAEDKVECKVTVSIKDGYVIGLGYKTGKIEDTLNSSATGNTYDYTYTYNADVVYVVSNVKSTDVSTKASKDITKAIQKAKDEKAADEN